MSIGFSPKLNYSADEQNTGKTDIDGKIIYQKTLSLLDITGTGVKTLSHRITGLNNIISISGYITLSNGGKVPIPRVSTDIIVYGIYFYGWDSSILSGYIGTTYTGAYALASGYITVLYTKN